MKGVASDQSAIHAIIVGVCAVHDVGVLVLVAGSTIGILLPAFAVTVVHPRAA